MPTQYHTWIKWLAIIGISTVCMSGCLKKKVVATVNNQPVTRDELLNQLEARFGMQTLQWLIRKKLVEDAMKKAGLTISDAELAEAMMEWRQQYDITSEAAFLEFLSVQGWTEQELREDLWMNVAQYKLATKDVKVSEEECKKYFRDHPGEFDRPATVNIAQIVCKDKATADKVIDLLDQGADFGEMASQYSIDTRSKANGGIIGEVAVRQLGPFAKAVQELQLGEYTNPLPFPRSKEYVIIKLNGAQAAVSATYAKVKPFIERRLRERKGKKPQEVVKDLLKNATIQVNVPRYLKLEEMLNLQAGKAPSPTTPGPPPAASGKASSKGGKP